MAERDNALLLGDAAAEALDNLKEKKGGADEAKIQKVRRVWFDCVQRA
jgi:hypothetical protein